LPLKKTQTKVDYAITAKAKAEWDVAVTDW